MDNRVKEIEARLIEIESESDNLRREKWEIVKNNYGWFVGIIKYCNMVDLEYTCENYEIRPLGYTTEDEASRWVDDTRKNGLPKRELHPKMWDVFRVEYIKVSNSNVYYKYDTLRCLSRMLEEAPCDSPNGKIASLLHGLRIEMHKLEVGLGISGYYRIEIPENERPEMFEYLK